MTSAEFLAQLFALTAKSSDAKVHALVYAEAGLGLGTKPWWPPLVRVWLEGPEPPSPHWTHGGRDEWWRAAAALLAELHADYLRARDD